MSFQDNLAAMPDIGHLSGLDILDAQGKAIHHIPNEPGKQGSLKLYNALALNFGGETDTTAAAQGLDWFAEHAADAQLQSGQTSQYRFGCFASEKRKPQIASKAG